MSHFNYIDKKKDFNYIILSRLFYYMRLEVNIKVNTVTTKLTIDEYNTIKSFVDKAQDSRMTFPLLVLVLYQNLFCIINGDTYL